MRFSDITKKEQEILEQAKKEFSNYPNIIRVRIGYVFKDRWITNQRAIVLTVGGNLEQQDWKGNNEQKLPQTFLGYPVEVTGLTVQDIIVLQKGQKEANALFGIEEAGKGKYVPPENGNLKKVSELMRINANVSPEKGWENLKFHLENVKKTLVVGMYDFGATHIEKAIEDSASSTIFESMTMAIQIGSDAGGDGTKKDDLNDDVMVENLSSNLGEKFHNAWIKVGKVNGWVPSSYHIKVCVSDSKGLSVSSGNWQSSNQPDLVKLENPTQAFLLKNYNREWHIILENETLAKEYEKYILNDYEYNKENSLESTKNAFVEKTFLLISEDDMGLTDLKTDYQIFEPFVAERNFTVTPLLSPDNFFDEALALVKSAKNELLIQNQTFNAPSDDQKKLTELINEVLKKQSEGVDVKVIFRNFIPANARENIEALVGMGFTDTTFKVHNKCHTKGVIVDGEKVMIGSQNWSNDGISVNRDASLLFEDKELAQYFRQIFFHDWTKLAKHDIGNENANLEIANEFSKVPLGMMKIGWSDILETL